MKPERHTPTVLKRIADISAGLNCALIFLMIIRIILEPGSLSDRMVSLFGLVVFSSPWIVFGCVAAAYTRVDLSEVAIRIWLNLGIGFYGLMMLLLPLGFTVMDHPRIAHHIWPWVWVLLVGTFLNAFHFLVFKLLKRDLLKCSTFDL